MKPDTYLVAILMAILLPVGWPAGDMKAHGTGVVPAFYEYKSAEMPKGNAQVSVCPEKGMIQTIRSVYIMGTLCTIQLYSTDSQTSLKQMESLILQLEKVEEEMSTWKETSTLSKLNRQPVGIPFKMDRSLFRLFETLKYWSEATGASFDPAAGKLLKAYGSKTGGKWPDPKTIKAAKSDSGMDFYSLDKSEHSITKTRDIEIDCGAFGKGEALDRLPKEDGSNGSWLVDLGGQIFVHGSPPGMAGWPVNISHPQDRPAGIFTIELRSGSLATSGGSERDVEVGKRRLGHILDPNTGTPAEFDGSVAVWNEQALLADILSTALYVMGPEKGLAWADSRNLAACFLVPDEYGRVSVLFSHAFGKLFSIEEIDYSPRNRSNNPETIFPKGEGRARIE